MTTVCIASMNPVKISCVRKAFSDLFSENRFDFVGVDVDSGVKDQPMTDIETITGAKNRAINAQKANPTAKYWVGIEGGIQKTEDGMDAFAWVVVLSKDKVGKSRTGTFTLPGKIADLVAGGIELGHADDLVFQRKNSKQKDGAIGILTDGLIDRASYYYPAVVMALIPFKQKELY